MLHQSINRDIEKTLPIDPSSPTTTWRSEDCTVASNDENEKDKSVAGICDSLPANGAITIAQRLKRALVPRQKPDDDFMEEPVIRSEVRKLESCDEGYPYIAAFMDCDENFMMYRRFGFLHTRLLLHKQDELRVLENELDDLDQRDLEENRLFLKSRHKDAKRRDQGEESLREKLLHQIEEKIIQYDRLLLTTQQLTAANKPTDRDYNSVARVICGYKKLLGSDSSFIYHREDLVTLRPGRESAWLDAVVERLLKVFPRGMVKRAFCSKETSEKTDNEDLLLLTKSRVDRLVGGIIMTMILALLIIPVYALYHVSTSFDGRNAYQENAISIGILLVATLAFSAALALFTKAKRHELLAAAAAYCALLVVFIANLGNVVGGLT